MCIRDRVGGKEAVNLVSREEPTAEIRAMLDSWPTTFDVSRAVGLGFVRDESFGQAVVDFKEGLKGQ